ncbi:hypothetical protein ACI3PH_05420 [Lactococcus lactis]
MTKDYLTSPFNDMDLKRISNTIDSISKTLEMYKSIMPATYLTPDVLPIYKAINLMSSIKYPIDIFTNLPKINPGSFAFPNQLAANLSKNQINSAFELINRNEKEPGLIFGKLVKISIGYFMLDIRLIALYIGNTSGVR